MEKSKYSFRDIEKRNEHRVICHGAPLIAQWLRICLAIQGMWDWSLGREIWSHMPWSNQVHVLQLLKLRSSGARAPQLESLLATTPEQAMIHN